MITIIVPVGGLVLDGKNVAFETVANVTQTSLVFTSYAPSRGVGLFLRGVAPTITFVGNHLPSSKALTLTTFVPFPFRQLNRTPPIDALVLTGQAPVVRAQSLRLPAAGVLVLAGQTPALASPDNRVVLPGRKQLVLFREAPLLGIDPLIVLGPPKGALSFAGQAPTAIRSQNIWVNPVRRSLLFTRYAPSDLAGKTAFPLVRALFLSQQAVQVTPGLAVSPTTGALTLTGRANFVAPAGLVLSLQGQPIVSINQESLVIPVRALTLTGRNVLVETLGFKAINVVQLTLAGQAPTISLSSFFAGGKGDILNLSVVREIIAIATPQETIVS